MNASGPGVRELKVGTHFVHAFWLDPSSRKPLECVVTKLARGGVYYRPYYGTHEDGTDWRGSPMYIPNDQRARYISEVLS